MLIINRRKVKEIRDVLIGGIIINNIKRYLSFEPKYLFMLC